jgi:hypothetical protein
MSEEDHGFHFTIWVPPGFENGLQIVSKSNWDGRIAICQRAISREAFSGKDLNGRIGAYILVGQAESTESDLAYIGRAEPIDRRLLQHDADKDKAFWTYAIILFRNGEELNLAESGYLEARLIELADVARTSLTNKQRPSRPAMSDHAKAGMDVYIEQAQSLLETLGTRIFTSAAKAREIAEEQKLVRLSMTVGANKAYGYDTAAGFVVSLGSVVSSTPAVSMQKGYRALRDRLIDEGVIVEESGALRFVRDYLFRSSSAAAGVVSGYSLSGPQSWKDENGKTLAEIQAEAPESGVE